jgi:DNA-binding beta-propeller fold protein YncE
MHKNTVSADATEATVEPDFAMLGSVDVERGPIADLAVTADGTTLVATHYGDGCVSLIDACAFTVDADIEMAAVEPHLVTAAERRAYVTVSGHQYDSVAVIDTVNKQVIANYPVDGVATDVAVSPDGTRIFAGLAGDRLGLAVVNTFGRTNTIDLADGAGRTVDAVRVSPNGRFVYVATSDATSGKLLVVDAAKGLRIREVPIASPIRDVVLSRDGALAYVASFDPHWGGSVDVVDTAINEITAKVGIGGAPMQMALSADGARLYIADYEHVAVLCTETNSVIERLTMTDVPSAVAISPDGTRLYIADHTGAITVMSVAVDSSEAATEQLINVHVSAAPQLRAPQPVGV